MGQIITVQLGKAYRRRTQEEINLSIERFIEGVPRRTTEELILEVSGERQERVQAKGVACLIV